MDLHNKTRNAIVRPNIVEGPIENGSTLASLLISIAQELYQNGLDDYKHREKRGWGCLTNPKIQFKRERRIRSEERLPFLTNPKLQNFSTKMDTDK